ncbi:hypothetical protein AnigIFM63309_007596 [Aspergillus niger]|nr:hypothetical protein AnigIFM63309_007596 [Aspergillus niger]
MDLNYTTIDARGDMLLVVERDGDQMCTRLTRFNPTHRTSRSVPSYFQGIVDTISKFPRRSSAPTTPEHEVISSNHGHQAAQSVQTTTTNSDFQNRPVQAMIRVSSDRLGHASPYFQKKLNDEHMFREVDALPARFDNISAIFILLNAIHGRVPNVPRHVTPDTLCMIALLTELWGCHNNMMAFSETWVINMSESIPKTYDSDVAEWIYIAWVFRHRSLFWYITRVAIRGSSGVILKHGLPIPDGVLKHIDMARQKHVDAIVISLYQRMESILEEGGCCQACDTMIVGQLMTEMKPQDLFPPPQAPYEGWSIDRLLRMLSAVPEPQCTRLFHASLGCPRGPCELFPATRSLIKLVDVEATGLDFDWVVDNI